MKNILITEDDEKMRMGLVEILKEEGYNVDSVGNGQKGLEMINEKDYDVVLVDLIMPVMGGLELLRNIKQVKPWISVIIITAFGTVENAVEAIKAGASDYITKPFKIDEVQSKIKKVFAEKEFTKTHDILDSGVIKAISNPIRKDVIRLLASSGKLKFTDIKNMLGVDDPTKLSFHLRVLKSSYLVEQDNNKIYMLSSSGKKLMESLKKIEGEDIWGVA
ncbi:MAG: response regulator [Candidatus Methanoperedenaceae archaeon]|nr:response regulator [Candidatus Methanoperedenaceae archaeon]